MLYIFFADTSRIETDQFKMTEECQLKLLSDVLAIRNELEVVPSFKHLPIPLKSPIHFNTVSQILMFYPSLSL